MQYPSPHHQIFLSVLNTFTQGWSLHGLSCTGDAAAQGRLNRFMARGVLFFTSGGLPGKRRRFGLGTITHEVLTMTTVLVPLVSCLYCECTVCYVLEKFGSEISVIELSYTTLYNQQSFRILRTQLKL